MKKDQKQIQNQRGQLMVEAVLLLAITMSLALLITRWLDGSQYAQKLISKPWSTLTGMIECGTWSGCGKGNHPSNLGRVISLKPDT